MDSLAVRLVYPVMPLAREVDSTFHNLVVLILVFMLCLTTLVLTIEDGDERMLTILKTFACVLAFASIVTSGIVLVMNHKSGRKLQRTMSLLSFATALVMLVGAAIAVIAQMESGTAWWIDLIVAALSALWIWRTARQCLQC